MRFRIKTLSPVHIGCGETYNGLTYLIDSNGKWLHWFEVDRLFSIIGPEKLDRYTEWLDQEMRSLDSLKSNQARLKRDLSRADKSQKQEMERLKQEIRQVENALNLMRFCQGHGLNARALQESNSCRMPCKSRVYNSAEISKFITQQHQPYIPGTEIKGAIRTAVLYCMCRDGDYQCLKKELEELKSRHETELQAVRSDQYKPDRRKKEKLNKAAEKLASNIEAHFLNSPRRMDPKYDVMKSLFVSDSDLTMAEDVLVVAHATPFNTRISFRTYCEYCRTGAEFHFQDISIDPWHGIKHEKLGFSQTQQQTMSSVANVFRCCHDFTNELIDEEISYFQSHGKSRVVQHLKKIKVENTPDSPILRIGKDQGYFSVTLGLLVKKTDPVLYEQVLIHTTKGKSYDSDHGGPLPKSRKLVHYDDQELTAGWVKLIPEQTAHDSARDQERRKQPMAEQRAGEASSATAESLQALRQKWRKQ